jgi:hypothetical protein
MLDKKLNIKDGNTVAIVNSPHAIDIVAARADAGTADAVILFTKNKAELTAHLSVLVEAAKRGALVWLAYPKAKQLGTDLSRDIIHDYMPSVGLDAVRQVAIDDTWSALRFKPLT